MKDNEYDQENSGTKVARIYLNGKVEVLRNIHFSCSSCGLCCRLNRIPVREEDILRFQEHGFELDQLLNDLSPVLIPSKNVEGNFIKAYILRKKPFVNECIFLDDNNHCRVHEFKPLACRLYPFALRREDDETVIMQIHSKSVCPSVKLDVSEEESNTLELAKQMYELFDLEK